MGNRKRLKVMVIGLDGATWNLIKPWADSGDLPAFKKMMEEGAWGNLRSCVPPVTSPAWQCYSTGCNPGKLGVYGFFNFDFNNKKLKIVKSTDFRIKKEIWDYLSEHNYKNAVINMPIAYPTKKINGILIAGGPTVLNDSKYTYPASLKNELIKKYGYKPHPDMIASNNDRWLTEVQELINIRFKLLKDIIKSNKYDFITFVIFHIDNIQHFFYDSGKTLSTWKIIDENLSRIIDLLYDDTCIFLMSDHGMYRLKNSFYLNKWLYDEKYLSITNIDNISSNKIVSLLKFVNDRIIERYGLTPILSKVAKILPMETVFKYNELIKKSYRISTIFSNIDWDKTSAFAANSCIYVNKEKYSEKYLEIRDEIICKLSNISDPDTGNPLFYKILPKEKLYPESEEDDNAPDIFMIPNRPYSSPAKFSNDGYWMNGRDGNWIADHDINGIFLAYGGDIKSKIINAEIYDLAPTILNVYGIDKDDNMDGNNILW